MHFFLPMKIYAHGTNSRNMLESAICIGGNSNHNTPLASLIEITNDANDANNACSYPQVLPMQSQRINHLIGIETRSISSFANMSPITHLDRPTQHAMAAFLVSNIFSEASFRSGCDVAVPMRAKWKVPEDLQDVANDVSRISVFIDVPGIHSKSLAAIVGWLAAKYLGDESKVKTDVQCKKMNLVFGKCIIQQYDECPSFTNYHTII